MTAPAPPCSATAPVRRSAALALLVIAASWWAATPVSAHGGEGVLALESFVPAGGADGPGRWDVAVRLTFAEDGHAVDEATVTVAGEDGAGTPLTPVALAPRGDGRFSGVVELVPGVWNLRVVSVEPPAQLALEPVTVSAPGPTSTAPSTDASTSAAPSTSVPPSTSAAPAEVAAERTTARRARTCRGRSWSPSSPSEACCWLWRCAPGCAIAPVRTAYRPDEPSRATMAAAARSAAPGAVPRNHDGSVSSSSSTHGRPSSSRSRSTRA